MVRWFKKEGNSVKRIWNIFLIPFKASYGHFKEVQDYFVIAIDAIKSRRAVSTYKGIVSPLSPGCNDPDILKSHIHEAGNLKAALDNVEGNIKNIAVSGPYGAGKSTFISTFERYNCKYKYLNISLATFLDSHISTKKGDLCSIDNKEIEESIVQHILYKEHPSKLPASSYKRIPLAHFSNRIAFSIASLLTLFGGSFLYFKNAEKPPKLVESLIEIIQRELPDATFIFGLFLCYVTYKLIYWFSSIALTFDFRRLLRKDGAIAVSDDASPLNQHLDEIIYFFCKTKYSVVIFEDLDRFNNVAIFTKLREINHLVNQSKLIVQDVKFIYAIKDELLSAKERTKFFDLIIPILPVVHPNNAFAIFKKELSKIQINEGTLYDNISEQLLKNTSRYIDDMRVLKNICNEYASYTHALNRTINCNFEKIFAMVVFKNLCPTEHSKLLEGKGAVARSFEALDIIKSIKLATLKKEIAALKEALKCKQAQVVRTEEDIFHLFWSYFLQGNNISINNIREIRIEGTPFHVDKMLTKECFQLLMNDSQFQIIGQNGYEITNSYNCKVKYSNLKNEKLNYDELLKNLRLDQNQTRANIENTFAESHYINSLNLKEYLSKYGISDFVSFDPSSADFQWLNRKSSDSLVTLFFLNEGYLAEDYPEYLSVFVEGAMTASDKNKINQIKAGFHLEQDYKFNKIDAVLEEFSERDARNIEFNHQIIFELAKKIMMGVANNNESAIWNSLLENILDDKYETINFILNHLDKNPTSELLLALRKTDYAILNELLAQDTNIELLKLVVENLDKEAVFESIDANHDETIRKISCICRLSELITNYSNLSKLNFAGALFGNLQVEGNSKEDFLHILKSETYELNLHMVQAILEKLTGNPYSTNNLVITIDEISRLSNSDKDIKILLSRVNKPRIKEQFIVEELCSQPNYGEPLNTKISLINELSEAAAKTLIANCRTIIDDILSIDNRVLWAFIFESGKVKATWQNVSHYIESIYKTSNTQNVSEVNLEASLAFFLKLDGVLQSLEQDKQSLASLNTDFIVRNILSYTEIDLDIKKSILCLFPVSSAYLEIEKFNVDNALLLIESHILEYATDIVNELISMGEVKALNTYIGDFQLDYLKDGEAHLLPVEVFINLLTSSNVKTQIKLGFIQDTILPCWDRFSSEADLKKCFADIFESFELEQLSNIHMPYQLILDLCELDTLSKELKTKLVASQISQLDWEELSTLLKLLDSLKFNSFLNGKGSISLSLSNKYNISLLKELHNKGYIGKIKQNSLFATGYTLKSKIPS